MPSSPPSRATGRLTLGTGSTRWRRRGQGIAPPSTPVTARQASRHGLPLLHAEMAAGHSIAGERTAQALTRAYPGRSLAWTTMARVLHEHGRHRDAVEPAREAVRLTEGAPNDSALLACILARIGEDGREESLELAERAIVEMVRSATGSVVVLASMADIVSRYADRDEPSLRHAHAADDLIWAQRDTQTVPPEWLGAAASRRCQSAWAPDAVLWLVRLAEASAREPAAPARWVVERMDSLGCMLLDPRAASREATLAPVPGAATIRRQSLPALLHAALSLGYSPDQAAAAIGLRAVDLAALGSEPTEGALTVFDFGSSSHVWAEHLSVLERGFGPGLVVRLRGSAAAQRALDRSTRPKMMSSQSSVYSSQNRSSGSAGRPSSLTFKRFRTRGASSTRPRAKGSSA